MTEETSPSSTLTVVAACGCGHDGRLGFGVAPSLTDDDLSTPDVTLLPFFHPTSAAYGGEEAVGEVVSVHCGAYHTIVRTTRGLFGWGLQEQGQLGLGLPGAELPHSYHTPTRLSFFDFLFQDQTDGREEKLLSISCGGDHSFVHTTTQLYAAGDNTYGQLGLGHTETLYVWTAVTLAVPRLIRGTLTHISCGTFHTLMAWKDCVLEERTREDGEGEGATTWRHYPLLLTASGKGDYGELGYDHQDDEVQAAKDRRAYQALLADARHREQQQGGEAAGTAAETATAAPPVAKKYEWKPKKQRRPEFSSSHMRPVRLSLLDDAAVPLKEPSAATEAEGPWVLDTLHASHLHSCVLLRARGGAGAATASRAFHWGCYYNREVEGLASSQPREVDDDRGAPATAAMTLHGGDEFLLRYNASAPDVGPYVAVLGGDDIFNADVTSRAAEVDVRSWRTLLPSELCPPLSPSAVVRRATGRNHLLLLVEDAVVMGFGSNLHGELGLGMQAEAGEEQTVSVLTAGLRTGQEVRLFGAAARTKTDAQSHQKWKVTRIRDVSAGARHSIFLLDIAA